MDTSVSVLPTSIPSTSVVMIGESTISLPGSISMTETTISSTVTDPMSTAVTDTMIIIPTDTGSMTTQGTETTLATVTNSERPATNGTMTETSGSPPAATETKPNIAGLSKGTVKISLIFGTLAAFMITGGSAFAF